MYEDIQLIGIISAVIIILFIITEIFYRFFPDNKVSKMLEKIVEWIAFDMKY